MFADKKKKWKQKSYDQTMLSNCETALTPKNNYLPKRLKKLK